ncbi:hypothetical protein LSTR_LSTR004123 [Laodelphax striatellus]|uniref:Uncharacterized protein n=1 Tax=Laodelphax striatellus TaxID=195883 RepID=A0A482WGN7_LAOST|nr:hypothetical protein LSTR_LSTR004123 [Laodelphax striatellus]
MEISTRATNTIILVTLLFAGAVQSAIIPESYRRQDESWAEEYNLVEPPPNPRLLLMDIFDKPKEKTAPAVHLKTIIKALYQLNAFDDRAALEEQNLEDEGSKMAEPESQNVDQPEVSSSVSSRFQQQFSDETQNVDQPEVSPISTSSRSQQQFSSDNIDETTVSQLSIELSPPKQSDSSESHEESTRSLGILLEDLVDTAHLPAHVESDRTEKFTHSFRYGYGIPFHHQGV